MSYLDVHWRRQPVRAADGSDDEGLESAVDQQLLPGGGDHPLQVLPHRSQKQYKVHQER